MDPTIVSILGAIIAGMFVLAGAMIRLSRNGCRHHNPCVDLSPIHRHLDHIDSRLGDHGDRLRAQEIAIGRLDERLGAIRDRLEAQNQ